MSNGKSYFSLSFIINPTAGQVNRSVELSEAIKRAFGDRSGIFEIKTTKAADETARFASEARKRGFFGVVACGGDGTVKEVAKELLGSKVALGMVPLGRANIIAGGLGVPTEIEQALRLIADATPRSLDVGKISGRLFLTSAGLCFDIVLSRRLRHWRKKRKKQYLSKELISFKVFKFEPHVIKIDEKNISHMSPFIVRFANIDRYGPEVMISPGARPDDGLLDVAIIPQIEFKEALKLMPAIIEGRLGEVENTRKTKAAGPITVEREGAGPVHVDGEIFEGAKNFQVELIPGALNVWYMK